MTCNVDKMKIIKYLLVYSDIDDSRYDKHELIRFNGIKETFGKLGVAYTCMRVSLQNGTDNHRISAVPHTHPEAYWHRSHKVTGVKCHLYH